MNNTLNATRMQVSSGTHFCRDKQKCSLTPQSQKVRMNANGPLAIYIGNWTSMLKRLTLYTLSPALGLATWSFGGWGSKPVLPSASPTSQCESAGRFVHPLFPPPPLPCYPHLARSHVIRSSNQVLMILAEGSEISRINFFAPHDSFSPIFPLWRMKQTERNLAICKMLSAG